MRPPGWAGAQVTGRAEYTEDVGLPGVVHAAVARSSRPHALVTAVDVADASRVPGVRAILTAGDIERLGVGLMYGPVVHDQPILAGDRVRYVGEPVVAIAADTRAAALEAAGLVRVSYVDLSSVLEIDASLAGDAPLLHEDPERGGSISGLVGIDEGTNVCSRSSFRRGDVERALSGAAHVFEDLYVSAPTQHVPLETHVCLARLEPGGGFTLWSATETPYAVAEALAALFSVSPSKIRVVVSALGGDGGGKCHTKIEPVAAVLAHVTRAPVRFELTREEEFVTVTRHWGDISLVTGVDAEGRIVARRSVCRFNTGAYADLGPLVEEIGGLESIGPYAIPNVDVESIAVYTNLPPAGAMIGFGRNEAAWAYESQMDAIATRLGIEPLEFRLRNLERGRFGEVARLLASSAEASGWPAGVPASPGDRKVRAKGIACAGRGHHPPWMSTATVRLNDDGSLNVLTGAVDTGRGLRRALRRGAAERLGIDGERVHVAHVDTALAPYHHVEETAQTPFFAARAMERALDDLVEQLAELAAERLEVDPGRVEIGDGRARSGEMELELGALVRSSAAGNVVGHGRFGAMAHRSSASEPALAVGAAEVEVDLDTGELSVLAYRATAFGDPRFDASERKLSAEADVAACISAALRERLVFDEGRLRSENLDEYMVGSPRDHPSAVVVETLDPGPAGDESASGLEVACSAVAPAIGNAVARAIGARLTSLPITPESVLRALREAEQVSAG